MTCHSHLVNLNCPLPKKGPPPRWHLSAIVRALLALLCLNPLMNARSGILVAEDDAMDALLLDRAVNKVGLPLKVQFVRDGQQAVDYLEGREKYSDREKHPLPYMLLLDLKMPFLNGFDVLTWVRNQPDLKRLLVVIFTSSSVPSDINRAYDLGANSYLTKPHSISDLQKTVELLKAYWLELNRHPEFGQF